MKTSNLGRKFIEEHEGFSPIAYRDQGGIWTIGYGRAHGVKEGDTCDVAQADAFLAEDLKVAEEAINRLVSVELAQNQFDALCSFVFNVGQGNFAASTLRKCLNRSEMAQAASEFMRWTHIGSEVSAGLVRRRNAEKELFQGEA